MQDVHLTCALEHLYALVDALGEHCAAQREEVVVLDFGCSYKQEVGYIVLEWESEVDEVFIEHLTADGTVLDFTISCVPIVPDDQYCLLEQVELQGRNQRCQPLRYESR
jgi:hypothetical protein